MDRKEIIITGIALLLCLGTTVFLFYKNPLVNEPNFHFQKVIGDCPPACDRYPGLYHRFVSYFVSHIDQINNFFVFNTILFLIIGPLVFYYFCEKKPYSIFFYLTGSVFWLRTMEGNYPSGLAILFFLLFLRSKNITEKVLLFLLALGTHNYSLFLFSFTWVIQILLEKGKDFFIFIPPFGLDVPYFVGKALTKTPAKMFNWFVSNFPVFSLIGFFELVERKDFLFLIIIGMSTLYSLDVERAFTVAAILLLYGFVFAFQGFTRNQKVLAVVFSFLYFFWNIGYFVLIRGM